MISVNAVKVVCIQLFSTQVSFVEGTKKGCSWVTQSELWHIERIAVLKECYGMIKLCINLQLLARKHLPIHFDC